MIQAVLKAGSLPFAEALEDLMVFRRLLADHVNTSRASQLYMNESSAQQGAMCRLDDEAADVD